MDALLDLLVANLSLLVVLVAPLLGWLASRRAIGGARRAALESVRAFQARAPHKGLQFDGATAQVWAGKEDYEFEWRGFRYSRRFLAQQNGQFVFMLAGSAHATPYTKVLTEARGRLVAKSQEWRPLATPH